MHTPITDPQHLGDANLLNEVFQIQLELSLTGKNNEALILEEMRLRYIEVCNLLNGVPSNA